MRRRTVVTWQPPHGESRRSEQLTKEQTQSLTAVEEVYGCREIHLVTSEQQSQYCEGLPIRAAANTEHKHCTTA